MTGLSQIRSESAICAQNQVSTSKLDLEINVCRSTGEPRPASSSSARPATESNSEPERRATLHLGEKQNMILLALVQTAGKKRLSARLSAASPPPAGARRGRGMCAGHDGSQHHWRRRWDSKSR